MLPPPTVPCKIQAENFDRGGEGIAYHIGHKENMGKEYRAEAVNIEICSDAGGGYDVFDLAKQEWLTYTINITKNLTAKNQYKLKLRIFCDTPDTRVHVEVDADNKTGSMDVLAAPGQTGWVTMESADCIMHDGEHILKFYVEQGKVSLNYIEIELA